MEKFFKLNEKGSNVKTELIAGLTTFLAMAYILGVNPAVLADAGDCFAACFFCRFYRLNSGRRRAYKHACFYAYGLAHAQCGRHK